MKDVAIINEKKIDKPAFRIEGVSLKVVGKPTFEQWEEFGEVLRKTDKYVKFWIGDWINYGEVRWGEKYAQALDETDYKQSTLHNCAYVARSIQTSLRSEELSFAHHQVLAPLTTDEQKKWMKKAEDEDLSVSELSRQISQEDKQPPTKPVYTCPRCNFEGDVHDFRR